MNIWLITVGEPLPTMSGNSRLWRTGLLAAELARRGHRVSWWTSRFDHFTKRYFATEAATIEVAPNLTIFFLEARPYRRNVSFARLLNHWQLGRHFRKVAREQIQPQVVLCSFPTIELSREAVALGRQLAVPVVIDIRDLWPDIFVDVAPRSFRWVVRAVLYPYFVASRSVCRNATALIGISAGYLDWGLRVAGRRARGTDRVVPLGYALPAKGLPTRSVALELAQSFGLSPDRITCLFSGTFGRTYDLAPIMAVAARFQKSGARLQFVICGDGERRAEWHAGAEGLKNVFFTGWLDQSRMLAMLAASDIGLAAYSSIAPQGVPNKVIEYLAAGLPVVSSLRGETASLLSESGSGISYEAADSASLESALQQLTDDETRRRFARSAAQLFEQRFRANRVYEDFADYLQCLGSLAEAERQANG